MNIILIGGGSNKEIDKYLLSLVDKPNILFIAHGNKYEEAAYKNFRSVYYKEYGANTRLLRRKNLNNMDYVNDLINDCNIIYIDGGNTKELLDLWKSTSFDKVIKNSNKILVGKSAGAIALCYMGVSDYKESALSDIKGLNLIDIIISPHYELEDRQKYLTELSKKYNNKCYGIESDSGLIIEDNKFIKIGKIKEIN